MNALAKVVTREQVVRLQAEMAKMPQVELPTDHYFADGMYCRTVFQPAGSLVVGKLHRQEHFYIVCSGTIQVTTDKGLEEITGPSVIVSKPGAKRAILAVTDVTYLTVHRTDLTDVEDIERVVIELEPEAPVMLDARNQIKQKELTK